MAWNVDTIYGFMKWLSRKNQSGGIRAGDFFFAWNSEQYSYHEDLLGRWQNRSNGKSGANTGLILNETIMTKLAPFTINSAITIVDGTVTKPDNFIYTLALRKGGYKIYQVDHSKLWAVLEDVIDPPSISNNSYYYTEYENYYSLLPSAVTGEVSLDYIASCNDVSWAYILDDDERQIYDAANSVQPLWNQNTIVEITKRALKSLGVSFKDADFQNYGQSNITTGD